MDIFSINIYIMNENYLGIIYSQLQKNSRLYVYRFPGLVYVQDKQTNSKYAIEDLTNMEMNRLHNTNVLSFRVGTYVNFTYKYVHSFNNILQLISYFDDPAVYC